MKSLGIITLALLLTAPAFAQKAPPKPTFTVTTEQPRTEVEVGAVVVNTHAAQIRIAYLPRLASLPGTFPTRTWGMPPNPFDLTGMQIPEKPRQIPAYISVR